MAFDPDAFLAKIKPAGGFDPDAFLAKVKPKVVDPRFVDDTTPDRPFSAAAQSYDADVAALKGTKIPTTAETVVEGVKNIGRTVKAGAGAAKQLVTHPVDTLSNPSARREALRGVDQMVTLGYGQKLASRIGNALGDAPDVQIGPETFSGAAAANTQEADRAAAPGFRELGTIGGMLTPGATATIARGGARAAKALGGTGILPSAARGIVGYEATAPVAAALSADSEGDRVGAALKAATDPTGLVLSGGIGALAGGAEKIARGAEKRSTEGARAGFTTGEQNAGIRKVRKLDAAVGEDEVSLKSLFERHPDIKKAAYVKGANKPAAVLKVVDRTLEQVGDELDDTYAKMQRADRLVTPRDVDQAFEGMIAEAVRKGDAPALRVLRGERQAFANEYGNFGKLSPETMRGLKSTAGELAFGKADVPPQVRSSVWKVYADAIERQAEGTPGVDPKRLRQLNKDAQILKTTKDALEERTKAAKGKRKSIGDWVTRGALLSAGGAAGGIPGIVAGAVAPSIISKGRELGRRVDYALSRRPQIGEALGVAAAPAGSRLGAARKRDDEARALGAR